MSFKNAISNLIYIGIFTVPAALSAAPQISVDTVDYNAGKVYSFDTKKVQHTFVIKNTGDSNLVISNVKASCGCTTVGYDTVIPPGKTGKLTQSVNIEGMTAMDFRKSITVFSNAKNNPEFRLSLGGIIKNYIDLSKQEIKLSTKDNKAWIDTITLTTSKADLAVTEISFKSYESSMSGTPAWQTDLRLFPEFTLTKIAGADKNTNSYNLSVSLMIKNTESQYGEFTIKTNHPKMPEIRVSGAIVVND